MTTGALGASRFGILLMCAGIVSLATMDAFAKQLGQSMPSAMVSWARFTIQGVGTFIVLAPWLGQLLRTQQLGLHLLRSLAIYAANLFMFAALASMDFAEAIAIFEVSPLLITLLAVVVLGERIGPRRTTSVGLGFVGMLIIVQPGTDAFQLAALLPLCAALGYASFTILTRFLSRAESLWTSFVYSALVGTVLSSAAAPFYWQTPTGTEAVMMVAMAGFGALGQVLVIRALTLTDASALAPYSYLALPLATVYGIIWFGESPSPIVWLGAALIVGSGLYVWHRERQ